ncbi:hypothetical protein HDU92_001313 [Lobulomyces angularis]|nr:hypothetical protein HDU92_001313 [Lobulomyces angularis]
MYLIKYFLCFENVSRSVYEKSNRNIALIELCQLKILHSPIEHLKNLIALPFMYECESKGTVYFLTFDPFNPHPNPCIYLGEQRFLDAIITKSDLDSKINGDYFVNDQELVDFTLISTFTSSE